MSSRPGTAPGPAPDYSRRDLTGHKQPVSALAWAGSGKRLASGSDDGVVKLWNIETHTATTRPEKCDHEFSHGSKEVVTALAFNPKRDELLAVVGSNVTKVYDLRAKSSASVICEAATPDAISAAWDGHDSLLVAQLNNTLTHLEPRKKRTHKPHMIREGDEVTDLAFIDSGSKLLVSTRYGVEVYAWPSYEHLTTLSGHALHHGRDGGVTAMAVSRGDRLMASGGMDALICIWDLQSATPLASVYTPDDAVRALSFNADQQMLAYCQQTAPGQQSSLDVVSVQNGRYMYWVPLAQPTESVAFNPRYPKLLAFGEPVWQGGYRDTKGKVSDILLGKVSIVHFGK